MSFEKKFVTGEILQQVAQGVRDKIKGEIIDNLESTDINKPLSANQGKILQDTKLGKNEKHEQTSDTITSMTGYEKAGTGVVLPTDSLNQAIGKLEVKADKALDVANNAVSKDNIVNDLTTGGTDSVLSAEQGKVLKQLISSVSGDGGAGGGLIENAKSFNKIVYNGTLTSNGKDIVVGKTLYNPSLYLDGTRIDASEYELNAKVGQITLKQPYAKYEVSWEVEDQLPNHIRFSYPTLDLLINDEPIKSIINIGDVIEIQGESDADDGGHKLVKCEDSSKLNGVQIGEGKYLNEIPNTNIKEIADKKLNKNGDTITGEIIVGDRASISDKTLETKSKNISGAINELNENKCKLINLSDQLQKTSYRKSVLALCEVSEKDNTLLHSYSSGNIILNRISGLTTTTITNVLINIESQYEGGKKANASILINGIKGEIRPCTFKYKGKLYGGLHIFVNAAEFTNIYFYGETNFDIFGLDYMSSDPETAPMLDEIEEIKQSLSFDNIYFGGYAYSNNNKIMTSNDLGRSMGDYAGGFPLNTATEGKLYYYEKNDKYYICTSSYSGTQISVPNGNFEELDVWKNRSSINTLSEFESLSLVGESSGWTTLQLDRIGRVCILTLDSGQYDWTKGFNIPQKYKRFFPRYPVHSTMTDGDLTIDVSITNGGLLSSYQTYLLTGPTKKAFYGQLVWII